MKKPIFWILLIIILSIIVFVYKKHNPAMKIKMSSQESTQIATTSSAPVMKSVAHTAH
jgi:hypothetical protein